MNPARAPDLHAPRYVGTVRWIKGHPATESPSNTISATEIPFRHKIALGIIPGYMKFRSNEQVR